jgi:hypothetical protein
MFVIVCRLNIPEVEGSRIRNSSRQGTKFGGEGKIFSQMIFTIFSDLCGLGAFARDIPNFGCGPAALGALWLFFILQGF